MYSILSDITYALIKINPLVWIILLFITTFIIKRRKISVVIRLGCTLAALMVYNKAWINSLTQLWITTKNNLDNNKAYNTAIVLGGFISLDKKGYPVFNKEVHRFDKAIELYNKGIVKKIIFSSGAKKQNNTEADLAAKFALEKGVCNEDIITETRSQTTYENAVYTKKILDSLELNNNCVLISSALHIPRAKYTFKKIGLQVTEVASNNYDEMQGLPQTALDYLLPDVEAVEQFQYLIKEVIGTIAYAATGKL